MTDASGQRQRAEAVVDTVKAELPPIWLGGRQRMVLVDEITQALTAARQEALQEAVNVIESEPELPGPIPQLLVDAFEHHGLAEVCRAAVRATKRGLLDRLAREGVKG